MVLASIGEYFGGTGWLVLMVILFLGIRQWRKWLKGNTDAPHWMKPRPTIGDWR